MELKIRKISYRESVDYVTNPIECLPRIMDGQLLLSVYYYNSEDYAKAISEDIPEDLLGDEYPSLHSVDIIVPQKGYKIMMSA